MRGVSPDTLTPLEQKITYYQKDLPKENSLAFTFEKADVVHKVEGV
jgi:hypothetical protein